MLTNRPGYSEDFDGIQLTTTKRLSDRWMLRDPVRMTPRRNVDGTLGFQVDHQSGRATGDPRYNAPPQIEQPCHG